MAEEKARDPTKPEIKPVNIPLAKIHDLPGSVFAPPSPKSLEALTSSIVLRGVQEPVILRGISVCAAMRKAHRPESCCPKVRSARNVKHPQKRRTRLRKIRHRLRSQSRLKRPPR